MDGSNAKITIKTDADKASAQEAASGITSEIDKALVGIEERVKRVGTSEAAGVGGYLAKMRAAIAGGKLSGDSLANVEKVVKRIGAELEKPAANMKKISRELHETVRASREMGEAMGERRDDAVFGFTSAAIGMFSARAGAAVNVVTAAFGALLGKVGKLGAAFRSASAMMQATAFGAIAGAVASLTNAAKQFFEMSVSGPWKEMREGLTAGHKTTFDTQKAKLDQMLAAQRRINELKREEVSIAREREDAEAALARREIERMRAEMLTGVRTQSGRYEAEKAADRAAHDAEIGDKRTSVAREREDNERRIAELMEEAETIDAAIDDMRRAIAEAQSDAANMEGDQSKWITTFVKGLKAKFGFGDDNEMVNRLVEDAANNSLTVEELQRRVDEIVGSQKRGIHSRVDVLRERDAALIEKDKEIDEEEEAYNAEEMRKEEAEMYEREMEAKRRRIELEDREYDENEARVAQERAMREMNANHAVKMREAQRELERRMEQEAETRRELDELNERIKGKGEEDLTEDEKADRARLEGYHKRDLANVRAAQLAVKSAEAEGNAEMGRYETTRRRGDSRLTALGIGGDGASAFARQTAGNTARLVQLTSEIVKRFGGAAATRANKITTTFGAGTR